MGFPLIYKNLFLPNLINQIVTFLSLIRTVISISLRSFIEPGPIDWSPPDFCNYFTHVPAALARELLPVVKFSELVGPPESCGVCLCEFEGDDDIRRLTNCGHVFHRSCVDRWMKYDQITCPMCRAPFVSHEMQETFSEQLWAANSGTGDYDYFS